MSPNLRAWLPERRYALAALAVALLMGALHVGSDTRALGAGKRGGVTDSVHRFLLSIEGRLGDLSLRLRGPLKPHPDVLLAVIDEASVQRYGRWPWSREVMARAIERLHDAGARSVGLDMTFTEALPDSSAEASGRALKGLEHSLQGADDEVRARFEGLRLELARRAGTSPDERLATAFSQAPEVVQGVIAYGDADAARFLEERSHGLSELAAHLITRLPGKIPGSTYPVSFEQTLARRWLSAELPLGPYRKVSPRWAHFNSEADADGVTRQSPLFVQLDEPKGLLPSLALQTAAAYYDATIEPVWDPASRQLTHARLVPRSGAPRLVPLESSQPTIFINYVGTLEDFPHVSLADVIDGKTEGAQLKGKAVLLGVSLLGEYDQIVTPYAETEAGMVSHASVLSSILTGEFLRRPTWLLLVELGFIFASALVLASLLPRVRFLLKAALLLGLGALYLALDVALFSRGYRLNLFIPGALHLGTAGFVIIFLGYLFADRERGHLADAFQHYVNPSVMRELLEAPEKLALGGEKRELTVLFSDIRGFTALSERMAPEALVKFINSYLNPMTQVVFDEGGTLDKYIGDALMAFWGAPVSQEDHALRACRAAVRFLDELDRLKAEWRAQNLPDLDIGVGINSGPMVVGNMGSDVRFDYTVMGDAVNLASRLEGINKQYGTRVLMSEATHQLVKDHVCARRLGSVQVKGKRAPVAIYELRHLGPPQGEEMEAITLFELGLRELEARRLGDARATLESVRERWPNDGPTKACLEELSRLRGTGEHPALGVERRTTSEHPVLVLPDDVGKPRT